MTKYAKICRLCLAENPSTEFHNLFTADYFFENPPRRLIDCVNSISKNTIKRLEVDGYDLNVICQPCKVRVQRTIEFQQIISRSQKILSETLNLNDSSSESHQQTMEDASSQSTVPEASTAKSLPEINALIAGFLENNPLEMKTNQPAAESTAATSASCLDAKEALSRHKPHPCHLCHKAFRTSSDLKRHTKYHMNRREWKCRYCDLSFTEAGNRNKHEAAVHQKVKNYHCDYCLKSFHKRASLQKHQETRSCVAAAAKQAINNYENSFLRFIEQSAPISMDSGETKTSVEEGEPGGPPLSGDSEATASDLMAEIPDLFEEYEWRNESIQDLLTLSDIDELPLLDQAL